ncbi:MAG: DUF2085 domain-containing protein [Candidatus Micrarchaeota archaeon]
MELRAFVKKNYAKITYAALLLVLGIFCLGFLLPPVLALSGEKTLSSALYAGYKPTCHQMPTRSFCFFKSLSGEVSFGDCTPQGDVLGGEQAPWGSTRVVSAYEVERNGARGYEVAVCSRDVAIYLGMLLGLLIYPFARKLEDENVPSLALFALVLIPMGIDGTTQLIGMRESTNLLRAFTGVIVGVALPFYIMPLLVNLVRTLVQKE